MGRFSKSSSLIKTFVEVEHRCGWLGYVGSRHGLENARAHGTSSEPRLSPQFVGPEYPPVCSAEVGVCLWELGEYRVPDTHFPALINPEWIAGQLALTTVSIGQDRAKVWATVELAKVRGTQLLIY
jgi:hypothetical protein